MDKFDCETLIKGGLIYLKKYNLEKKSWSKIMKDNEIPIQQKNLLNGIRYIYSNEVNNKLEKCCIKNHLINVLAHLLLYFLFHIILLEHQK